MTSPTISRISSLESIDLNTDTKQQGQNLRPYFDHYSGMTSTYPSSILRRQGSSDAESQGSEGSDEPLTVPRNWESIPRHSEQAGKDLRPYFNHYGIVETSNVNVTASPPPSPLSDRQIDQISAPWLSESAKITLKLVLALVLFLLILAAVPLSILLLPHYAGTLEA